MGKGKDPHFVKLKLTLVVVEARIDVCLPKLETRTPNIKLRVSIPASSPLNDISFMIH